MAGSQAVQTIVGEIPITKLGQYWQEAYGLDKDNATRLPPLSFHRSLVLLRQGTKREYTRMERRDEKGIWMERG